LLLFPVRDVCYLGLCTKIRVDVRPEKYVSICSDSQAALKALEAAKTLSPLVQQYQRALNDISTRHSVRLFLVPGHSRLRGNEIADEISRGGTVHHGGLSVLRDRPENIFRALVRN
jgi:ribonuclease HI